VYTDRIGVRGVPLRVSGSGTTVTHSTAIGSYDSVTLASSVFTCTPHYAFRIPPFLFGQAGTTSAGGVVTFSNVNVDSFKANSLSGAGAAADNTINVLPFGFGTVLTDSYSLINMVSMDFPCYLECFKIQGTGTAALSNNATRAVLTDNGTGDYTVTLREGLSNSLPLVFGTAVGNTSATLNVHSIGPTSVQVKTYDAADAPVDADFYLFLFCPSSSYLHGNNRAPLQCTQRNARFHLIQIDVTAGTPVLTYAPFGTSIVDTGIGIYTITFATPFKREPYVLVGNQRANISDPSATSIVVRAFTAAGALADPSTPIYLLVYGFDDANEYW